MSGAHTPGAWEYVPGNDNHGPYVSGPFGGDICDCYTMSNPSLPSVRNGGSSQPVLFQDAEANARLIAAAPDLLSACLFALQALEGTDRILYENGMMAGMQCPAIPPLRAAIAKATNS